MIGITVNATIVVAVDDTIDEIKGIFYRILWFSCERFVQPPGLG